MNKNYVTYHLHTENSLLDSCTNYKLYIDKAVELGQKAICFTEHGNIYNWIEKKMYANEHGLKYLHGCEVYLTEKLYWTTIPDNFQGTGEELKKWIEDNKYKVRDNYHTILIAKNQDGFKEINKLIDLSTQEDHFYYKPRITFDEFFNISDNVIKISACLASPLNKYPNTENANKDLYTKLLKSYDFYELQPHNHPDQIKYNKMLLMASEMYGIPLIAGTDTHSLNKYKAECRSILQRAKDIKFTDEDKFDLTYKSYDELVEMFVNQNCVPINKIEEAINNTNIMADMCEDWELDKAFKYPVLYDDEEKVLKQRINRMYKDKIKRGIIKPDPRYKEMVQEEMRVFKKIGMVGFMLFMSELVTWCWENDIPVGFCRGSVGGSMIAYLTDIIDVNPLTWGTIFSRFANEDRKEIGDIDLDISPSQRQLVFDHIIEEFGIDKTAYVLAIGTMVEKGTIDEIGRALSDKWKEDIEFNKDGRPTKRIGNTYQEDVTKILPYEFMQTSRAVELFCTLNNPYSLDNIAKIKKEFEVDAEGTKKKYPDIFYYYDGLLGTAISQSMHPAGIIVSPVTLADNYGTFWNKGKHILSINMEEIHEVSLVKYDILGLKNIEIIKDACKLAHIPYPKSHTLNWDDALVWEHINDSPVGIFQFESPFAYDSMKKMGCKSVNDLSMVNASIRPSGESYRERLLAREINKNPSEIIDKLLESNRGFLIFQEDTIKFLMNICGLAGSDADNVRRAIGRKQVDRLEEALPSILEGYCSKSDKPREVAEEEAKTFLKIIEDSSRYQFGYNHSTGYSMIGYTCAYLRYYYPKEFITAYLNNANNDKDINDGTALAEQFDITIHPARFRHSVAEYSCDDTGIHKGLSSIKFLNEKVAHELYELKDEHFDTFIDLLVRLKDISINSKQLGILIKINFFEEFGNIKYLLKLVNLFDSFYGKKQMKKDKITQLGYDEDIFRKCSEKETEKMFTKLNSEELIKEMIGTIDAESVSVFDKLRYELECLGYVSSMDKEISKRDYFVVDVDVKKSITNIKLHEIYTGKSRDVRMWSNGFIKNEFNINDVITIISLDVRNKKEPTGEIDENGKRVYRDTDKKEYWLKSYLIKERGVK